MEYKELIVKTFFGMEEVLMKEVESIGGKDIKLLKRAIAFRGSKELMYKANYHLRSAVRVLVPIFDFGFKTQDQFYKIVNEYEWEQLLSIEDTFAIDSSVHSEIFTHSGFVTRYTKDAIVDRFRDKYNKRPSIDTKDPDLRINVHISNNRCSISLDSSQDPLYKRGYRVLNKHEAPLNEALAAAMILLSGWDGKTTFVDPMCGSGTLPIEASMISKSISPGAIRGKFGFMKWKDFDSDLFVKVQNEIEEVDTDTIIIGADIKPEYSRLAKVNARNAGVNRSLRIFTKAFENLEPKDDSGVIFINPPYGERLVTEEINEFYSQIGSTLKHKWTGYDVWILSSNYDALKFIGLKPSKKYTLFNGKLECKFLKFSLYEGSLKKKK